jgi:NAD-dependent deacetylase
VSAESGIPTFRGADGLWKKYRAEELATPQAFARDPKLVWEWYDWRRQIIAAAAPNPAHLALAAMGERLTLITQNVDGLHDLAGSKGILKIHGDIWVRRCTRCLLEVLDRVSPLPQLPPPCPKCGAMQRPGVVWFGEGLPQDVWQAAEHAAQQSNVFLVIGTSAQVYPAASLVPLAKRAGAKIVEVNIARSGVSSEADAFLEGPAGEILPRLFQIQ